MSALFSAAEVAALRAPHVNRAWFARLALPMGEARLHEGVGRHVIEGEVWSGVSDPIGGRLVGMSGVEEPAFGQAAAVTITLSGVDKAFLQSVHASRAEIEGRRADLYWCAFDAETQLPITRLVPLWPNGRMSSPSIQWAGIGFRSISITIESEWASQNFVAGRKWNAADQQRYFPGDLGLDFIGIKVTENVK